MRADLPPCSTWNIPAAAGRAPTAASARGRGGRAVTPRARARTRPDTSRARARTQAVTSRARSHSSSHLPRAGSHSTRHLPPRARTQAVTSRARSHALRLVRSPVGDCQPRRAAPVCTGRDGPPDSQRGQPVAPAPTTGRHGRAVVSRAQPSRPGGHLPRASRSSGHLPRSAARPDASGHLSARVGTAERRHCGPTALIRSQARAPPRRGPQHHDPRSVPVPAIRPRRTQWITLVPRGTVPVAVRGAPATQHLKWQRPAPVAYPHERSRPSPFEIPAHLSRPVSGWRATERRARVCPAWHLSLRHHQPTDNLSPQRLHSSHS